MPVATRKRSGKVKKTAAPAGSGGDYGWRVVTFNCECHSFEEVEAALIKAVRCSLGQARAWSSESHAKGSVAVYEGTLERCEAVAEVLGAAGLKAKVVQ